MEYLIMIIWMLALAAEVYWNWYKIEIKNETQNHWLWTLPILAVGISVIFALNIYGYLWYWSGLYILTTRMLFFSEALNIARGKNIGYLGEYKKQLTWREVLGGEKSFYDYILQKVITNVVALNAWFWFRVIICLFAILNVVIQGKMTWIELNYY